MGKCETEKNERKRGRERGRERETERERRERGREREEREGEREKREREREGERGRGIREGIMKHEFMCEKRWKEWRKSQQICERENTEKRKQCRKLTPLCEETKNRNQNTTKEKMREYTHYSIIR